MFQLVRKIIITVQLFIEILDFARNKGDDFVQRFEIETYEGWNFNSGNYLFTTDTK